jgi:hypothetical protein
MRHERLTIKEIITMTPSDAWQILEEYLDQHRRELRFSVREALWTAVCELQAPCEKCSAWEQAWVKLEKAVSQWHTWATKSPHVTATEAFNMVIKHASFLRHSRNVKNDNKAGTMSAFQSEQPYKVGYLVCDADGRLVKITAISDGGKVFWKTIGWVKKPPSGGAQAFEFKGAQPYNIGDWIRDTDGRWVIITAVHTSCRGSVPTVDYIAATPNHAPLCGECDYCVDDVCTERGCHLDNHEKAFYMCDRGRPKNKQRRSTSFTSADWLWG